MIRVYFYDTEELADDEACRRACDALPDERRLKVLRMRRQEDVRRSVAAGLLLERALDEAGVYGEERKTEADEDGRPFLPKRPEVSFNLSHSGRYAMCVISDEARVGCDIQRIPEQSVAERFRKLARRFFAEGERLLVDREADDKEAARTFTRLWALKESYVKAVGKGLKLPLDSFEITFEKPGKPMLAGTAGAAAEGTAGAATDGICAAAKKTAASSETAAGEICFAEISGPSGYCCAYCTIRSF